MKIFVLVNFTALLYFSFSLVIFFRKVSMSVDTKGGGH